MLVKPFRGLRPRHDLASKIPSYPYDVVNTEEARELAAQIARKPAAAVRFAKAALNHIDPQDLHGNYRLEQGYTYQLNIMGIGDQQRDAFITKEREVTR